MEGIWKARRHSALSHDGVDDYEKIADSASLDITDAITIEAWVKPVEISSYGAIAKKGFESNAVYSFYVRPTNTFGFNFKKDGSWVGEVNADSNSLTMGKWAHVAVFFDGVTVKLYKNGIEVKSEDRTGPIDVNTTYHLYISRDSVDAFFNGLITSVRIYNRALSDSEIKYLYYNPDDPLDTDHLVLWLHPGSIDTDAGYWWDLSGHDNHGQIFGATKVSLVSPEVTVL